MILESYKELVREVVALSASMIILAKVSMWDVATKCKSIKKGGRKIKQTSFIRALRSLQNINSDNIPSVSEDPLLLIILSFIKNCRLSLLPLYKLKGIMALIIEEEIMNNNKGAASQLQ